MEKESGFQGTRHSEGEDPAYPAPSPLPGTQEVLGVFYLAAERTEWRVDRLVAFSPSGYSRRLFLAVSWWIEIPL